MSNMRKLSFLSILLMMLNSPGRAQNLELNDLEYFERQGVNILVFSNSFNGGFNDEKNSGIEVIHHGVRTVQGGAVRLNNTPEQWDLVPKMTSRKVDKEHQTIEVGMRYAVCFAHLYFPDSVRRDMVFRAADWLYGCHPYHNYSFVAVVGATRPKQVFYGNNRADFSFIPGNVAPGLLFRRPDHFENYDDWPFLWGQNEGTIAGNTQYIIFGSLLKNIVGAK